MPEVAMLYETFVSVDVETAGPHPAGYALLSIGACLVADPNRTFYIELQPTTMAHDPGAMAVHGLSLATLATEGTPPAEALAAFDRWLAAMLPGQRPTFVALNAPFDWMFVTDYFHRFLGRNPFGHAALDLKALYMGLARVPWAQTSLRRMAARYGLERPLTHHALRDAQDQARLLRRMLEQEWR